MQKIWKFKWQSILKPIQIPAVFLADYSSAKFFANKVFSILIAQDSIDQFGMFDGRSEINLLSWHCLLWFCGIGKMFIHCHLCCLLADNFFLSLDGLKFVLRHSTFEPIGAFKVFLPGTCECVIFMVSI